MPAGAPVPILGVVSVVAGGRAASEVAEELLAQLADEPRVVQCDLTGTTLTDVRAGEDFAPVGSYLRHWPGTVVMMHAPDPDVRVALSAADLAERVLIHGTWDAAELRAHRLLPAVQRRSLTLPSRASAPSTAREFVARTLQDWRLHALMTPAGQVAGELVTDAVINVESDLVLSLSRLDNRLRVAVSGPTAEPSAAHVLSGCRNHLVDTVAEGWGVIPGYSKGRTVWAVLESPAALPAAGGERGHEPTGPRHRGATDADVLVELHSVRRSGKHRRTEPGGGDPVGRLPTSAE